MDALIVQKADLAAMVACYMSISNYRMLSMERRVPTVEYAVCPDLRCSQRWSMELIYSLCL